MAPELDRDWHSIHMDRGRNKKRFGTHSVAFLVASLIFTAVVTAPISLLDTPIIPGPPQKSTASYTLKAPIRINNDSQFFNMALSESWPGNGSTADPYIISGYEIDARGGSFPRVVGGGGAIYIGNTTAHFKIVNCLLYNSSDSGIYLYNVSNGNLESNICENSIGGGISLDASSNVTIIDNNCSDNQGSSNPSYSDYGDGIVIWDNCENVMILNNTAWSNKWCGIYAQYSDYIIIRNNTCGNNTGDSGTWCCGGISFCSVKNSIIDNNTCKKNSFEGIRLEFGSNNCIVSNNSCLENGKDGIALLGSNGNRLFNNNCSNNIGYAVNVGGGLANWIWNNTFNYNKGAGDTYNDSHIQAFDSGTSNLWSISGTPHGYGNWWRDWQNRDFNMDGIQDAAYNISGSAGTKDFYPLAALPSPYVPEFSDIVIPIVGLMLIALILGMARKKKA